MNSLPAFDDDTTKPLEDRIGSYIAAAMPTVFRRVIVSPAAFWDIVRRTSAKVESGPHGEFVVMIVATGRLYVVPEAGRGTWTLTFERQAVS